MLRNYIFIVITALCAACSGNAGSATAATASTTTPDGGATSNAVTPALPTFNTDSAMAYLRRQVDFGPRVPGSAAHTACADWLATTLRSFGATVTDIPVTDRHPVTGAPVTFRNIFAQINPGAINRVLILAHYDTRPWADNDPDPANRRTPIDGANDGASGVAVALELARLASQTAPTIGLDILLTDLEDSGDEGDDESWCIGSQYWAANRPAGYAPRYAILLDMVGGRDAVFPRESFSQYAAPWLNDKIRSAAGALGLSSRFPDDEQGAINDDHLSLLRAGIPAIDIIEIGHPATGAFNPTWHTLADNIGNIDPTTLGVVGQVLTKVIYDEK